MRRLSLAVGRSRGDRWKVRPSEVAQPDAASRAGNGKRRRKRELRSNGAFEAARELQRRRSAKSAGVSRKLEVMKEHCDFMNFTRRDFGKAAVAALPVASAGLFPVRILAA